MPWTRALPFALALALGASSVGCATGSFEGGVYRDKRVAYRVGALPAAWHRVIVRGGQLAFHNDGGGTITATGDCPGDDAPLDVLTNHLVAGLESRKEVARAQLTLDGRAALRTRIDAALDGVPVALDLVVVRKDGCTYDLQLVSSRADHDARRPDFDRFVNGFARAAP